ncbi:MAG: hypothetical protein IPM98_14010 [Lewinellaceae bacterium]|nr:hypothetical protein [Lewinellaceae bacterium]
MHKHTTTGQFFGRRLDRAALLLALPFLLLPNAATAQREQRFKAGIIAGVTASQIDGDASARYHKVGLQGGLRHRSVAPKQDASIEFLFTQRGPQRVQNAAVF